MSYSLKSQLQAAAQCLDVERMREVLAEGARADVAVDVVNPDFTPELTEEERTPRQLAALRLLAQHNLLSPAEASSALSHALDTNPTVVQLLLDAGADPNHADEDDGYSALHDIKRADVMRVLVAAGANVNAREHYSGNTPIHECVAAGCDAAEAARVLLAAGADVDARNFRGDTPLVSNLVSAHYAGLGIELASVLLAAGADPSACTHKGVPRTVYVVLCDLRKSLEILEERAAAHRAAGLLDVDDDDDAVAEEAQQGGGAGGEGSDADSNDGDEDTDADAIAAGIGAEERGGLAGAIARVKALRIVLKILIRAVAWRRRRHLLLAVRERYGGGEPAAASAAAAAAAGGGSNR